MEKQLADLYRRLRRSFGHQNWWPGNGPWEVMVGAILTQGTNWKNVERALDNLKNDDVMEFEVLSELDQEKLEELLVPCGFYRIKAKRLRAFLDFVKAEADGDWRRIGTWPLNIGREKLLSVTGIGPETADSILLYAFSMPTFVVDAYTKRILGRHGLIASSFGYERVRSLFMDHLPPDPELFNDYHAQLVNLGKEFCRSRPRCGECPARTWVPIVKELTA